MLGHGLAPHPGTDLVEHHAVAFVGHEAVHVRAGRLEVEAVPDGAFVVYVVVAGQHDHRAAQTPELAVHEVDVGVVDPVVVEQVARNQEQIGVFAERRLDDTGKGPLRPAAKAVGRLVGIAAVQVHIGGVHDCQGSLHRGSYSPTASPSRSAASAKSCMKLYTTVRADTDSFMSPTPWPT